MSTIVEPLDSILISVQMENLWPTTIYVYQLIMKDLFFTHSLNIAAIQLQSSSHCYSLEPVAMAMAA